MSEDIQAELARLRAENAQLRDQHAQRVDGGLSRLAAHASAEGAAYRAMLAGAEPNGEEFETAHTAANLVLRDMGII